ncbi:MAG: beta-lactamase family protein [Ruminococcus sp.]|nr:beta-lactamase family protein [Ruminococcus sp.]
MKTLKIINFKKIGTSLLAAAMLLSSALTTSAYAEGSVTDNAELDSYVTEYMSEEHTPGLSLVAVEKDTVSYKNWGYDNISKQIPATEHTPYEIGSVSMAFTALSVLLLQEEGKLSINDSVSDYLPWFNVKWHGESYDLKIWQLLNHSSGIPEVKTYKQVKTGTDEKLKEETARIAEGVKLDFEPGTEYEYCNLNYDILAYLTEVVSGERFEDYVTREIFQPIGMTETGYDIPTAQGYQRCFWQTIEYDAPRMKGTQGDGGVITTTADMSLWIKAQLGQLELPEKLTNAIERSHRAEDGSQYINASEDGEDHYYLNGWEQKKDGSYMQHSGGNPNFTSMLYIDRERNIGSFAVSNMFSYSPLLAAYDAYKLMKGEELPTVQPTPSVDSIASPAAAVALIVLIVIIVFMMTQKKRLAKKSVSIKKEKKRLCLRMTIFELLLVLSLTFPYLIGYNYKFAAIWLPYSILIAFTIFDIDLILLIVSSIMRYIRQKKLIKSN